MEFPTFTAGQRSLADASLAHLQEVPGWSGDLPVLLLDRCWLRLRLVPLERLAQDLPPDVSAAAPELERYKELLQAGVPAWQAQQFCWLEFGPEACHQALRRFWQAQDRPTHGWTLQRYLEFLTEYRQRFRSQRPRPLPLLVLGRMGEEHGLFWLRPDPSGRAQAMRHTCA